MSENITERVLNLMLDEGLVNREDINKENYKDKITENAWNAEYLPFVGSKG